MAIVVRMLFVVTCLAGWVINIVFMGLMIGSMRNQAEAQLDYGRALRHLPAEVGRENQEAANRRVCLLVSLMLGGMVLFGVVCVIAVRRTSSPWQPVLIGGGILAGLLVLASLTFALVTTIRSGCEALGWPDGPVLLDLGMSDHAAIASRNTALLGVCLLLFAIRSILGNDWLSGVVSGILGLSTLASGVGGVGRIGFTERGLRYAPRFWPWEQFVRYVWSDDGRCVALRQDAAGLRPPWVLVPVPEELRDVVDALLRRLVPAPASGPESAGLA